VGYYFSNLVALAPVHCASVEGASFSGIMLVLFYGEKVSDKMRGVEKKVERFRRLVGDTELRTRTFLIEKVKLDTIFPSIAVNIPTCQLDIHCR
jgi:hypothetical protein